MSIGIESTHAPVTPVKVLVPPGPVETLTTPGSLYMRASPSAAIAAACS